MLPSGPKLTYLIVIGFVILCSAFLVLLIIHPFRVDEPSYSIPKQVRYSFTLRNKTNTVVNNVEFLVFAPVKTTSTQSCQHIESSQPFQIHTDGLGNQILCFSYEKFPPLATKIVTIKADLLMSEKPNRMPGDDTELFIRPSRFIESDHSEIINISNSIIKDNIPETVESIFSWVSEHITYTEYDRRNRGALYALNSGKGDCTEYVSLFSALCRAARIPTKSVLGYACHDRNCILRPSGFHNWAEFCDGKMWNIVDPQRNVMKVRTPDYIAMKIEGSPTDNPFNQFDRFHIRGEGITVVMN